MKNAALQQRQTAAAPQAEAAQYSMDYMGLPMTHTPPWGALTVADVFLNNASLGLFLAAAFCVALGPDTLMPAAALAFVVAWLGLLLDLGLLVLDLGDPARFHHMLRTVRPTSPMWVGVWALSLSSLFMTFPALWGVLRLLAHSGALPDSLALWADMPPAGGAGRALATATLALGALSAAMGLVYKGVLFSATSRPVWKDARWFPAYITSGALLMGCAVLTAFAVLGRHGLPLPEAGMLAPAMLALLAVDMVLLELHLRPLLRAAGENARAAGLRGAAMLDALACASLFFGGDTRPALLCAVAAILLSAGVARYCFVKAE